MIFVGDIALPYSGAVDYSKFPKEFFAKNWVGNLEGALIQEPNPNQFAVFNQLDAIRDLQNAFNFQGLLLANNHILDTGSCDETLSFLNRLKIPYTGMGRTLNESCQPLVLNEGGQEIVIVNFGWEVIQCEAANEDRAGVNPLRRAHVLSVVKRLIKKYPVSKVIPFMHWSYELEAEPQPFERKIAKELIDIGAAGVIGCHPHRIGGVEIYKDKPIVYSLGNWLFRQNYFHKGKLKFPDFCNRQMAFEWNFEKDSFNFHFFEYEKDTTHSVRYLESNSDIQDVGKKYTPFLGMSDSEYKRWYSKNHYHKNKGLPVYYWEDSDLKISMKNKVNRFRDLLLSVYLKFR